MQRVLGAMACAMLFAGCGAASKSAPPPVAQLITEIYVRDIAASEAFYEKLGFTTTHREKTFREMEIGGRRLFLSERKGAIPARPAANLRVGVSDVDGAYAKARRMGWKILAPIENHSWGERDFMVADPDGFGLRFTGLLPDGKW